MSISLTSTKLDFDIKSEIGHEGRNSNVYTAHDRQLDCEIVIKKVAKTKFSDPSKYFEEARRLNASEHQHVVPVKFASEDSDFIYIAMPYFKNGSLKSLINSRFLTVREIIRYATQFLSGLNNIHVKGLIHFDIKPDNILITNSNEAVVSDFGLAKNMNLFGVSEQDRAYMKQVPPEALSSSHHTMLFDIYSAGVTLYRLCNGNNAFYQQYSKYPNRNDFKTVIRNGQFPDRKFYQLHIPGKLKRIINKAMSVDPTDRQQTVLQLLNELSTVNEYLDWQYSERVDTQQWIKETNDKIIRISLKKLANLQYEMTTTKTIKSSNNTTKISDGCKCGMSNKDAETLVLEIINSID